MRDFTIDLVWAKLQMAFYVIGGWIGWLILAALVLLIAGCAG